MDINPHGAVAMMGTSLSSAEKSRRRAARRPAADLVAAVTPPGDARAGREVPASSSSEGAAAGAGTRFVRRPRARKFFLGEIYAQLCGGGAATARDAAPLRDGGVLGFIFALAFSLLWSTRRGPKTSALGWRDFSSEDGLGGKRRRAVRRGVTRREDSTRRVVAWRSSAGGSPRPRLLHARRGDGVVVLRAHVLVGIPAHDTQGVRRASGQRGEIVARVGARPVRRFSRRGS